MNKIMLVVGLTVAIILLVRLNTVVNDIQYDDNNILEVFEGTGYFDSVSSTFIEHIDDGTVRSLEFTNDGSYLAVGIETSKKIQVYEWNTTTLDYDELIPSVNKTGLGNVLSVEFNDDDDLLVLGHTSTPYIKLYDVINNFDTVSDIDLIVDGTVYDSKFYEGEYLIVGGDMTNYLQVFQYDDDNNFSKLSNNIDVLPTGRVTDISYRDGYIFVSTVNTPYMLVYKVLNGSLVKVPDPTNLPVGSAYSIDLSDNGMYVVVGTAVSPYVKGYKFVNGTFTDVNFDVIPTQTLNTLAVHFIDNSYFYVAGDLGVYKYKIMNDSFVSQVNDLTTFSTPVYVIDCTTVLGRLVLGDIADLDFYTVSAEITFDNIVLSHKPDRVNSVTQLGTEKDYLLIDNIMSINDELYNQHIYVDYNYIIVNENQLLELTPVLGFIGIITAVVGLVVLKERGKKL